MSAQFPKWIVVTALFCRAVLSRGGLLNCGAASAADRPNFVFFLVDDLGYMDVGANNPQTFYETPNVDRLAATGVRFTNGYAANPVCSPTRYSIMTGKYPSRVDATNFFSGSRPARFQPAPLTNRMPLEEQTLPESLQAAGYKTAFFGKWHLGPTDKFWPENQGFDLNFGGHSGGMPRSFFSPYSNPRLPDGPKGEHLTKRLADDAVKTLEKLKDDPFLLYLAFYTVHTPLQAPQELVKKYKEKASKVSGEEFADEEQVWPSSNSRKVRTLQKHATYAAMVESMDTHIGRVIKKLDDLGLTENTVVIFTSDNGGLSTSEGSPTSNLPLRGGKGWLYEGGIREPFIVKWPGVAKAGSTCDVPVVSTDFYPTMLEMANVAARPKQHQDGESLVGLLKGGKELARDAIYWHYPHYSNQGGFPGGAVRMGDWKLVERYEDGRVHLYDLKNDIGERAALAKENAAKVAMMRAKLHAWYQDVDAKFLRARASGPKPWAPK